MWFWKIVFWSRANDGSWIHSGETPYFKSGTQKAMNEHWNAFEESGVDATVLLWWSKKDGWVKYEQLL